MAVSWIQPLDLLTYIAGPSILTGLDETLIDVSGTDVSSPASRAVTRKVIELIL